MEQAQQQFDGPWSKEPDALSWVDDATGLDCHILRVSHSGHLCGYVRVPEGHPLHGVAYNGEVPECLRNAKDAVKEGPVGKRGAIDIFLLACGGDIRAGDLFDVHGSITYSGDGYWLDNDSGHWFGFDCAHAGDFSPESYRRYPEFGRNGEYRDIEYVKAECTRLAAQIAALSKGE